MARFLCILGGLLLTAAPAVAQKRVAFLVGVNKYQKPGFPDLEFAERDVQELRKELIVRLMFDEVVVLTGKDATRHDVEKRLKALVGPLTKDDLILVALSGHGLQFEVGGKEEGFFCPVDAVTPHGEQPDGANLLSLDRLIGLLKTNVGTRLLLVDACRNEPPLPGKGAKGLEGKSDLDLPPNTAVLFSCSARQRSWEHKDAGGGHSVFTHCVLEALREGAKKRQLTWTDLVGSVEERMAAEDVRKLLPKAQTPVESKKLGRTLLARFEGGAKVEPKMEMKKGPVVDATQRKGGETVEVEIAKGVKMTFCWVPKGKATLGSNDTDDDNPEHEFATEGFWLGKYEVTQEEWRAVMGKNPSCFVPTNETVKAAGVTDTGRFPVENVSWDDCQEFLKKLTATVKVPAAVGQGKFALPHEDQWEYACRGGKGNKRAFYVGDTLTAAEANIDFRLERTTKVGSYEAKAAHPWGLCDMHGNVWEWCENKYDDKNDRRVRRGGSWGAFPASCRSLYRVYEAPGSRDFIIGFRVALLP
jgi:sulfatase modifying factor 1